MQRKRICFEARSTLHVHATWTISAEVNLHRHRKGALGSTLRARLDTVDGV